MIIVISLHILLIAVACIIYAITPSNIYVDGLERTLKERRLKNSGMLALYVGIAEILYIVAAILDYAPLPEAWGIPMEIGAFILLLFAVVANAKPGTKLQSGIIFVVSSAIVIVFGMLNLFLLPLNVILAIGGACALIIIFLIIKAMLHNKKNYGAKNLNDF